MAQQANAGGALSRIAGAIARELFTRSEPAAPSDWFDRLLELQTRVKSGQRVTIDTALQTTAVLACARVIAEGVAQTPLYLKRLQGDKRTWTVDEQHPVAQLMRKPNEFQTGYEFRETLTLHAALCGAGRAAKIRNSQGRVVELLPLIPANVVKKIDAAYNVTYEVQNANGAATVLAAKDVLEIQGPAWDGVNGLSAVKLAREAIGLALATEESHARLHANGVRLAGVLTTPAAIGKDAAERIKKDWNEAFGGTGNWYKTPVLEGGLDFKQLGQTAIDAQHLETRRYQIEEICRAFRVFPQMVMHTDKTTTFASAEQFFLAHVNHTLGPWVERWSQRLDLHLLAPTTERELWLQFDLSGLAPGDAKTRAGFYSVMINAGVMTPNEARGREGLNPVEGGDELRAPVNLAPVQGAPKDEPKDGDNKDSKDAA